jgi:hypothetical protein
MLIIYSLCSVFGIVCRFAFAMGLEPRSCLFVWNPDLVYLFVMGLEPRSCLFVCRGA